ncbi:AraC family transcriptional regulator [Pullulanibacillus sp. KACC 23026]|uniref:AraC family transcriptional regulator n=1 Tax=Pullulanibacillus sp. KACC 23026 TaxID=3028315 RepID=UPI0023B1C1DD|nr:AraC family transcriptional regulator [Pullulanibacillus sp. KACC 23026]WEG12581.1 AraC family transcriptional regulator [Pullulanibacillus sp. KACC 23026]
MTVLPLYLSDYPNMNSHFPFHLSIHTIKTLFPSHRHDFLEFSLVIKGHGTEIVNGKPHPMKPGTFTFISPYQIHEIHSDTHSPLELYNCNFDLSLFEMSLGETDLNRFLMGETNAYPVPAYLQLDEETYQQFEALLREMLKEYNGNETGRELLIRAKLIEVMIQFIRLRKNRHHLPPEAASSYPKGVVWQVVHYIHNHYQDPLSLTHLAKLFNVSAPYLSEQFKQQMGESFVTFLHEVRLRHACSLLISTDSPVTAIAHEVGYNSFKTFSRAFRSFKGTTPSDYRAK